MRCARNELARGGEGNRRALVVRLRACAREWLLRCQPPSRAGAVRDRRGALPPRGRGERQRDPAHARWPHPAHARSKRVPARRRRGAPPRSKLGSVGDRAPRRRGLGGELPRAAGLVGDARLGRARDGARSRLRQRHLGEGEDRRRGRLSLHVHVHPGGDAARPACGRARAGPPPHERRSTRGLLRARRAGRHRRQPRQAPGDADGGRRGGREREQRSARPRSHARRDARLGRVRTDDASRHVRRRAQGRRDRRGDVRGRGARCEHACRAAPFRSLRRRCAARSLSRVLRRVRAAPSSAVVGARSVDLAEREPRSSRGRSISPRPGSGSIDRMRVRSTRSTSSLRASPSRER